MKFSMHFVLRVNMADCLIPLIEAKEWTLLWLNKRLKKSAEINSRQSMISWFSMTLDFKTNFQKLRKANNCSSSGLWRQDCILCKAKETCSCRFSHGFGLPQVTSGS